MSALKKWIVITSGDRPIKDISADLQMSGFSVENELEAIGQITGEGGDDTEQSAMNIPGVVSVIPSHDDISIGDPGADITW